MIRGEESCKGKFRFMYMESGLGVKQLGGEVCILIWELGRSYQNTRRSIKNKTASHVLRRWEKIL